jgi:hypothetical protein
VAVTVSSVAALPSTCDSISGVWVVTTTSTAWLPSSVGELTRLAEMPDAGTPFRLATESATEASEAVELAS